jgi:hypothetical protein
LALKQCELFDFFLGLSACVLWLDCLWFSCCTTSSLHSCRAWSCHFWICLPVANQGRPTTVPAETEVTEEQEQNTIARTLATAFYKDASVPSVQSMPQPSQAPIGSSIPTRIRVVPRRDQGQGSGGVPPMMPQPLQAPIGSSIPTRIRVLPRRDQGQGSGGVPPIRQYHHGSWLPDMRNFARIFLQIWSVFNKKIKPQGSPYSNKYVAIFLMIFIGVVPLCMVIRHEWSWGLLLHNYIRYQQTRCH